VVTSLNQCLHRGRITIDGGDFTGGEFSGHPRWFHHDGVGYVMLGGPMKMEIRAGLRTGSWNRISNSQKADKVERSVLSPWVGCLAADAPVPGIIGRASLDLEMQRLARRHRVAAEVASGSGPSAGSPRMQERVV
jgi:hypothetical protein